ncbi:MAG: invasion associated locus B family protein [Rhodospirillaceae bacterium]|nr:invasion associated locus B family protein [Rhodospirillaceae bacterium]
MPVYRKFHALALGAAVAAVAMVAAVSAAQAKDGDKFGAWTVQCPKAEAPASNSCRLMQIDALKDKAGKPIAVLRAAVFHMGPKEFVLFGYLPLGYAIAPGVTISVDGAAPHPMFAQRCVPQGCELATKLEGPLLEQMKKGKEAKIEFHIGNKTAAVPVSLKGMSQGLSQF